MTLIEELRRVTPKKTARIFDSSLLAWLLLVIGLLVLARLAFRGWIPHDEGTLGQAASRVLRGEVPHVDFHDTYGGLQAYAHSAMFSVIGESIRSLRIANIAIAAIASFASFTIVRRVQPVVVAASVGFALMLIGFAAYPASMPSWWNAALGLASVALVLRWIDSRKGLFLVAAGLVGGTSFLVKSTGAYVAAAIALYLIILASADSSRRTSLIVLGTTIVAAFGVLLTADPSLQSAVVLMIPLAVTTIFGFRMVSTQGPLSERAVTPGAVVMFSASCVVPVLVYAFPYLLSGNGEALLTGWFRLPQLRFEGAAWTMSLPVLPVILLAAVVLLISWIRSRFDSRWAYVISVGLVVIGAILSWPLWWLIAMLLAVLSPLAVATVIARSGGRWQLTAEQLLLALVISAFAFIQFPVSNLVYALYLVPYGLTVAAVWIIGPFRSKALAVVLFLTASIVAMQVERGYLHAASPLTDPVPMVALETTRGGIDIPAKHAFYVELVDHLEEYSGSPIYAGPDSPEVYFLSGTANPTPVLFDFLAESWRIGELDAAVRDGELSAVVVNRSPDFSPQLPQRFVDIVETEYPDRSSFGWFDVYEDSDSRVN
jgi:Dolichyl-phosphate-mannose-protein mannosyltransferase